MKNDLNKERRTEQALHKETQRACYQAQNLRSNFLLQFIQTRLIKLDLSSSRRYFIALAASVALGLVTNITMQVRAGAITPIPSLKTVPVPGPSAVDLAVYVRDKKTAIMLGKALFWDTMVGSDNKAACASCHSHAGADNRVTNILNPGLLAGDRTFQLGTGPNYTLQPSDFPLTKYLADDTTKSSDVNDIVSSPGVLAANFTSNTTTVGAPDICALFSDGVADGGLGFHRDGLNTRRVPPRNSPTVINAVFNFRNFWDGRANNVFNGGDPFGLRNPNAFVWKRSGTTFVRVPVALPSSSLASQASGPPLSQIEMGCNMRAFANLGKKMLSLKPLSQQDIALSDSVLSPLATARLSNTSPTYNRLIQIAFQPAYWNNGGYITLDSLVKGTFKTMDLIGARKMTFPTELATQTQANFPLFFAIAIQLYEQTLVSNDAPIDRFADGDPTALSDQQQRGMAIFTGAGRCISCHGGAELTHASFANVVNQRLEKMPMADGNIGIYDNGFYNIGVRPTTDDIGIGGKDPFGNPLSETGMVQLGKANLLGNDFDPAKNPTVGPTDRIVVNGAFKTPSLRNVELTGPYFHNGGKATLMQVVDFYNRGGDFAQENQADLDPDIAPIGLTEQDKQDLVAFLLSFTDDRVRFLKAPFDHPAICLPNGHVQDATGVLVANPQTPIQAGELASLCLAANGAGGVGTALETFMQLSPFAH